MEMDVILPAVPKLAKRLIGSAKAKRVIDLSVTLDEELPITWPGVPEDEKEFKNQQYGDDLYTRYGFLDAFNPTLIVVGGAIAHQHRRA